MQKENCEQSVFSAYLSPPKTEVEKSYRARNVPELQLSDCKRSGTTQTVRLFKSPKVGDQNALKSPHNRRMPSHRYISDPTLNADQNYEMLIEQEVSPHKTSEKAQVTNDSALSAHERFIQNVIKLPGGSKVPSMLLRASAQLHLFK